MQSLIPQPKQLQAKEGEPFQFSDDIGLSLYMEQDDPRLVIHCQRAFPELEYSPVISGIGYSLIIQSLTQQETNGAQKENEEARSATQFASPDEVDLEWLNGRAEGYRLEVTECRVVIRALDAPGLYYGLQTLLQLRTPAGEINAVTITDWPDTSLRAMNFDLRQTFSKPELLLSYLADFARYKTNAVLIEYEDKFPFRKYPEFVHPQHSLSLMQLEELKRIAHEYFIEIIPLQQSFGHLEYVLRHDAWKHLRETELSIGEICPSHPEAFELITGLLQEMMDAHPDSRYIHLGCDEVYSLCECERCKMLFGGVRERAFIAFLNTLIEYTASCGRKAIFWHDMLDKCPPEELAKLDKRSVAMIWIYNGRNIEDEVSSLADKFSSLGIEVMGAPAVRSFDWAEHQNYPVLLNRTDNLCQWAETANKLDLGCIVATNWTGPFSLGVPYGIFETTWYPMLLHADLAWNRQANSSTFIDRFMERFHGIEPRTGHAELGNYQLEDYYDVIWKLLDMVRDHKDEAELIAIMHDFEKATDRSRAIHKYVYRLELYPGDDAEWRSLLNNYTRNRSGRERVLPRMKAALERYQPSDMAEHFVKSRFYLHEYLERTLYTELGFGQAE